jgi:PAS domain S-box-containing protein
MSTIYTLIVDDSEFFAEMTAQTLSDEHGMRATDCNSVAEAKEVLEREPVDCIVSDYEMPGEDGLQFLEWVRDNYEELPFILLTGRGDEEIASEAIAGGVADYLLKLEVVEDNQYGRLANRIRSVVDKFQAQQKYQRLVENSPDAIVHVTADGEILAANRTFADAVGRPRADLTGASIGTVLPVPVAEKRLDTGRAAIETGEATELEDSHDGRHFHNLFVPLDGAGGQDSFQLIARDITERKERERELRRQNERLETFASVVTHDLRNPLNVAVSSLELLEGQVGDTAEYDRIDRSLDRMDALIEDVLTLARQGEEVTDPEQVALESVVREAWANVAASDAKLATYGSRTVEADTQRLKQLLENLFRNAVEHGSTSDRTQADDAVEHAGPGVTITVGALEDGFYVADDGPGIDPTARETVTETGYSTSREGTGIGLTIVQSVVDAHDWDLAITDSDTGGARFEITGLAGD